jgi:hypothetical protein
MAVTRELETLLPTAAHASLKHHVTTDIDMENPTSDGPNGGHSGGPHRPTITPSGPGPKRKLPKMNPSERAKYYRRRVREYTETLASTDSALARDVQNLQLIHEIQHQLLALNVTTARHNVLTHVWAFMDARHYARQHALQEPTHFEIRAALVQGDASGVIIRLDTVVSGVYSQSTVEGQLYPWIPGNARLLDKLLRTTLVFTSSFRFYFGEDGTLVHETSETDFAAGLLQSLQCSAAEARQILQALGNPDAVHLSAAAVPSAVTTAQPPRQPLDFTDKVDTFPRQ